MNVPRPALAALLGAAALAAVSVAPRSELRAAEPAPPPAPLLAEPALSPDGAEIAFVSGGDIWTVPAEGGTARLLVSDPANDSRPLFSPDGRRLAFTSTRAGGAPEIYVLSLDGGDVRRLTYDDASEALDGWSPDGKWVYYSSNGFEVSRMNDVYRVPADGGTPAAFLGARYVNENMAAPSPDGQTLAFVGRGFPQWWRRGSSGIDRSALWLRREGAPARFERLTDGAARDSWPLWAPDGRGLYFVSDRGGPQNVWFRPLDGPARAITTFRDGRVLWPTIAPRTGRIAFERDFRVWTLDPASGQAAPVAIALRGAPARRALEHQSLTSRFDGLALSPDGKKVAFVARGDVYAASAKDGGEAERVTTTPAAEVDPVWAGDTRLVYASERDGATRLYAYDFARKAERALTAGPGDAGPRVSPKGTEVAFVRDGKELRVVDLASGKERLVTSGLFERHPFVGRRDVAWSPDGKHLAYFAVGDRRFTNVWIAPSAGGEARAATFLANVGGNAVSWSPDGTFLLFTTGQRTESGQLARVDLVPRVPRFREDQFRDLFREEAPPALNPPGRAPAAPRASPEPSPAPSPSPSPASTAREKPVEVVFDGLRQRLSLLPTGVDAGDQVISPDGKWVVMVATAAGQTNLFVYSLDELAKEEPVARQLTATPGEKSDPAFTPDNKEVFYLDQGRIHVVPLDGKPRPLAVTAERDVDFDEEKAVLFAQAWTYLRDHFHDPGFHGVDWAAVREAYAPRVAAARIGDELRRTLNLMVGELDASHLGVQVPGGTVPVVIGRTGLRFDRAELESSGRLRVAEVVPNGPADVSRGIHVGDVVTAVDGTPLDRHTSFDALLQHQIGKRTALTVAPAGGGAAREVVLRPVNAATEKSLLYRNWVEGRRGEVRAASRGRLGYVHLFDMSAGSLAQFHVDLDAENLTREGVVVDVRNNNGGFINVYAIDVLARREYLKMKQRGLPEGPARTILGQRALERPTILVTNQDALSDAEDFTEGYRAHGLGKVVGEPTAGWIIYTWNQPLVDGSLVRLPRMTVTTASGEVMERRPRPVDVPVEQPIGDGAPDAPLETAVRELLGQLDASR